jgi:putative FmdB family regulatory protein
MPLYEYKCGSCGKTFEVIQKFADEPLKIHPECGGEVVRLLSAPAFHLKGTGWYATDYAKKSNGGSEQKPKEEKKPDSGSEGKESKEAKSGTETKETKPAAPAETKPSTTP